jgi:ferrous iron transport protein B
MNIQGLSLMGTYLLGVFASIGAAWVFKKILKAKEASSFIMEMPDYKSPNWKSIFHEIRHKTGHFLIDAGKIIIAISIVLWAMASYAPGDAFEQIEQRYENSTLSAAEIETVIASEKLEVSYAGILGKTIEPVIKPLGFDWKIGIALISSFAAREVFVSTMATIYSVGESDGEDNSSIRKKLQSEINPVTGEKKYSLALGLSLIIFYAFAMQCMTTMAVVYRETGTIKWPLIQLFYMTGLAWLGSFIVYQIFS